MPKTNEEVAAKNATRSQEEFNNNKYYQWNDETSPPGWELKQGATPDEDIAAGFL